MQSYDLTQPSPSQLGYFLEQMKLTKIVHKVQPCQFLVNLTSVLPFDTSDPHLVFTKGIKPSIYTETCTEMLIASVLVMAKLSRSPDVCQWENKEVGIFGATLLMN